MRATSNRCGLPVCLLILISIAFGIGGVGGVALAACRDCAQPGFGGPADNRFTAYDTTCDGATCVSVNLSNLTLYVRATDLAFPGFALERSYNSDDTHAGPFGVGWSFNVGESLTADTDGTMALRRGSGKIDRFAAVPTGGWLALTPTTDTLTQNSDGTYTLSAQASNTTRTFSADGRLLSIQDAGVTRVALDYDGSGRLTAARYRGRKITFTYDDGGRITSASDTAGRSVSYSYTADGRLQQYQYDAAGNLTGAGGISVSYGGDPGYTYVTSVTGADGTVRKYDIPLNPTQIRLTDGNGNAALFVSNAAGLLKSATDANGNTVSYAYDASGRRISVTNASGETAKFTYDASGNLGGITDNAGNRWSADWGATGPAHITDPNGNVWTLKYDAAGNLTGVSDPAGGSMTATRSAAEQITAITNALGNKTAYQYDGDGLMSGFTDALGGKWSYGYDGAARVSSRTDPGGAALGATYDANNALTEVTAGDTKVDFGPWKFCVFDKGQLSCSDGTNTFTYDSAGQLTSLTMPGGKTVTYQYDAAHRLTQVSDWQGNFAVYRYDAAGYPASVTVSGGPATIYQYDTAHRLKAIVSTGADGTTVVGYRYTLDANGNRTGVSALEPGDSAKLPSFQYGFDAAGHPVSRSDGETYQYDARGNLAAIQGGRNIAMQYDAFGRLSGMSGDATASYSYGAMGQRTARVANGTERHFDVWNGREVMESDAAGAPVAWYIYGLGLLWKVAADGTPYFYHFDGDGNVVAVSNTSAGVVNRYRYDPAGMLVSSTEGVENAFRARGEAGWMDDGNGLLFTGSAFRMPDLRVTLPATVDVAPPDPQQRLAPRLAGAGACFIEGVANCAFASGRSLR